MESSRVNLALLSFPQHFFMCNYIPPLIENRTLPKFSHNKELLFPRCAYVHVRVCVWVCVCVATTASYPWVFPLILSLRLISYGKLITDWLYSCSSNKSWTGLRSCFESLTEMGPRTIRMLSNMCIPGLSTRQGLSQDCGNLSKHFSCYSSVFMADYIVYNMHQCS